MKLIFLVSRQKKAALCIDAIFSYSGTQTGRVDQFGQLRSRVVKKKQRRGFDYPSRVGFDPEFANAKELALWRSLFGPDVERLERESTRGGCLDDIPWQNESGVFYTGWRLWSLHDIFRDTALWKPWPPSDLELLGLDPDKNADPAPRPRVLGADSP